MLQNLVVSLNKSVRIRFKKEDELIIRIVEQKQIDGIDQSEEFLIDTKTPIAQAIMGHRIGEKIIYKVGGDTQMVEILEIK